MFPYMGLDTSSIRHALNSVQVLWTKRTIFGKVGLGCYGNHGWRQENLSGSETRTGNLWIGAQGLASICLNRPSRLKVKILNQTFMGFIRHDNLRK